MALRYIGRITRPYGTSGAFHVEDIPNNCACLSADAKVYIGYSAAFARAYVLSSCRTTARGFIMAVQSIDAPESLTALAEMGVFAAEEDLRDRQGSTLMHDDDIIGCMAIDTATNQPLGRIIDIWHLPANDVWVVDYQNKELPLPVIDDVIGKVDVAAKQVEVHLLPGLLDLAE